MIALLISSNLNRFEKWTSPKLLKTVFQSSNSGYSVPYTEAFYSQWTRDHYKTTSDLANSAIKGQNVKPMNKRKNLQHYTFGGMTNIRNTPLYGELGPNRFKIESEHAQSFDADFGTGREVLTGFAKSQTSNKNSGYVTLQRPTKPKVANFFEQAYGPDPKKAIVS